MSSRLLVAASCLVVLVGVLGRGDIADGERYGKLPPPQYYMRQGASTKAPGVESSTTQSDAQQELPTATDSLQSPGTTGTEDSVTPSTPGVTSSNLGVTSSNLDLPTAIIYEEDTGREVSSKGPELSVGGGDKTPINSVKVSAILSSGTHAETYRTSNSAEADTTDVKAPDAAFSWESNPGSEVKSDELFDGFANFLSHDDPKPLSSNKTDGGLDIAQEHSSKWSVVGEKEGREPHHDKTSTEGERTIGVKATKNTDGSERDSNQEPTTPEKKNSSAEVLAEDEKPMTNMFNTYNTFNLKIPADEGEGQDFLHGVSLQNFLSYDECKRGLNEERCDTAINMFNTYNTFNLKIPADDGEGQEFLHGVSDHFSQFRLALEGIAANHTDNLAKLLERIETLETHSWELELELGDVRAENMRLKQDLEETTRECRDRNAKLEKKTCQAENDTLRLKEELEEVKLRWAENVTKMEEECFRVTHSVNFVVEDMENRIREETNKNMSEVQDNIAWGCLAVQGECRSRMDNLTQEVKKVTDNRVAALTQADASTVFFPAFTPANARDCAELFRKGVWQSGVYRIQPDIVDGGPVIEAFCDMDTESGGWTVIQRRPDWMGPLHFFNKSWTEYSSGFGDVRGEHWLGNEALHHLTNGRENVLRIDMRSASTRWHASYSRFNVGEEDKDYRLALSNYHGNAGDALTQNGKIDHMPFTTFDRDNDACADCNCATDLHGAWWYQNCEVGLNGEHGGVNYGWNSREISLYPEFVEMKTRPKDFDKLVALSGLMAKENHFVEYGFEVLKEERKNQE